MQRFFWSGLAICCALALALPGVPAHAASQPIAGPADWPPRQTLTPPPSSSGDWSVAGGRTWTFPGFDLDVLGGLWWGAASLGGGLAPDPTAPYVSFDGGQAGFPELAFQSQKSDQPGGVVRFYGGTQLPGHALYEYCTRVTVRTMETNDSPLAAGQPGFQPWAQLTEGQGFKVNILFEAATNSGAVDPETGEHAYSPCLDNNPSWTPAKTFYDAIASKPVNSAYDAGFTGGFNWTGVLPTPVTGEATEIGQTTAKIAGTVNFHSWGGLYGFEYGPSTAYGQGGLQAIVENESRDPQPLTTTLTGLTPGTTYHYRIIGQNRADSEWTRETGPIAGEDRTFTTLPAGGDPGGGGPGGGSAGGGIPTDTAPPAVVVRFFDTKLGAALKKGLSGTSHASEPGDWAGTLTVAGSVLAARRVIVATGSGRFNAGTNRFKLKFKKKAAGRLRQLRRVKLVLKMNVTDAAGNSRTSTKKLTLRR
jgi:hypothetical protein